MKKLSLALFLCFCCTYLSAQTPFQVKGIVADSTANLKLRNATISILNAKDSTLYKFTRAAENGEFNVQPMRAGNFIMLLTYPDYADYVYQFKLDEANPSFNFRTVNMRTKATLLNEVIIKGQAAAIKIKGDTTEFNAASYTIQPNDKVEDLLKKMPGIQIDKDGKITAQGKTVPKILVDGEEFFGDDPTLVTKNLRADMVDKVQLYEKKSDQATFTGVDDGEKTQTINIKLKEDKKNGYFGKAEVGVGSDSFYQAQAMFNAFKAKQKFSIYGVLGNNGKTGLDGRDADRLGTNSQNVEFMDGGMTFFGSSGGDGLDSWGGQYYGEGIPTARNSGVHYDTKFNKDKESINANYKLGSLRVEGEKETLNQNNLPTGLINSNSNQITNNYLFRQNADAIYTIKLDTTSNLKVTLTGSLKENETKNRYNTISNRGDNSLINTSNRELSNNGEDKSFNVTAFYTKQLKKKGRTFSLNVNQAIANSDIEGFLNSKNDYYSTTGVLNRTELIDQFKTSNTSTSSSSAKASYTEPINTKLTLIVNYAIGLNSSDADKKSFNASAPGNYDVLDTKFSNHFEVDQFSNAGGASVNYRTKKSTLYAGTQINNVSYSQQDALTNTTYSRNFLNWMPNASYQYRISTQKSFRIGYDGRTSQPGVSQLQPVLNNNDPLNIPLGNPDLKPSYNNNFNLNFNSYKILTSQEIYISARYGFTSNSIVSNRVTDPTTGVTVSQSINLTDKMPTNYSIYSDLGRKFKFVDMNVGLSINTYGGTSYNYINNVISKNTRSSYDINLNLRKSKEKKYEAYAYFGPTYSIQESSLQKAANNNGWGFNGSFNFRVFLPGKVEIASDLNYERAAGTASFGVPLEKSVLNSSISKKFLKTENLKMTIAGNDLFNQNRGFSRYVNENMLTQTSYITIQRYFMYSITWDFNKMGGVKK